MREQHGGTVTFLFTDIEGSTRLVQHFKDRWPEVRSQHRRIVRAAFEAQGGDEVDTQGDSFFYVFGRARDAALAAADATRALAAHEWPEHGEVRIRIGMHTGEPVVSEEGYHGVGVHRAARIMAAGHGGQVLLSEATAAVLRDEEVEGVGVKDLGVHRLKDLERPEHVYQLVAGGLEPAFPKIRTAGEEKPYYKRPLVIGAAAGVLAAAVAIPVFALAGGSGGGGPSLEAADVVDNAVAVVDERSDRIAAQTTGIQSPRGVATGADAIWVSTAEGSVAKIDSQSHDLEQTIDVGDGPQGLAVNGHDVWVANSLDGTVSRVSAETDQEVAHYDVGNTPIGVATGAGSVWVTNAADGTVTQLDARDGKRKRTIDMEGPVHGIAYGAGSIWVTDPVGNAVVRVPVDSPSVKTRIPVGSGPTAIAYGNGQVWVTNQLDGTVSRIDAASDAATGPATFPVGASPNGIAVTPNAVWVSDEVDGTIVRVDPKTGTADPVKLGGRPHGVGAVGNSVWVAVQTGGDAHRGGNLRALTPALDFVDPAFAYFPDTWNLMTMTNDGLVAFKHVGGSDGTTLVPNLATRLPQPSDSGRTYAFQLRRDIRFSNGAPLTPADVRATFERLFRASGRDQAGYRIRSPRLDYYANIVGARKCRPDPLLTAPKVCDLSRGIVTNDADRSVTFHLRKPDPDFLYKLAVPFAGIVPKGTAANGNGPKPGTGPYRVASYTPHRRAHLERNPYFRVWWPAARPDGLVETIDIGTAVPGAPGPRSDARAGFRATAAGRLDYSGAGVPKDELETARTRYPAQLHVTPTAHTEYVLLNTKHPPFSSPLARRALAFAIDRQRMVELVGGPDRAATTCQLLSPGFPGYEPYCPYTVLPALGRWSAPDLRRARESVARSGTRGAPIRMITTDEKNTQYRAITDEVAATLRKLGYRVSVKHYPTDREWFGALFNDSKHVDAVANGWIPDYPASGAFFGSLSCATPNPYVCSPARDRRLADMAAAASGGGSKDIWTRYDREVTDGALVVPMFNPKTNDFVSRRLGNYQRHPVFGPLLDQAWVQ